MQYSKNSLISEVVATDFRTAEVFKNNKIDFCCNGNRSILDAAIKKNIDVNDLLDQLNTVKTSNVSQGADYNSWPIGLLADYIQRMHHSYVNQKLPIIKGFLNKIRKVHGTNHPELFEVFDLFEGATIDLVEHMKKEEEILFAYARSVENGYSEGALFNERVEEYLNDMVEEHENEGERFKKIRQLTNDYVPPHNACTTYRVSFSMLEDFEDNLHKHIHLENNILCPKLVKTFEYQKQ